MIRYSILLLTAFSFLATPVQAADQMTTVQAKRKPGDAWKNYDTRLLSGLAGYDQARTDSAYSKYGGLLRSQHKATGFFYTKKIGQRWILVDPDGYLFLNKAVAATRIHQGQPYEKAFPLKFSSEKDWANQTTKMLRDLGYNSSGGFAPYAQLQMADDPLVFSPVIVMLRNYGNRVDKPGPIRWVDEVIPIFNPELRTHMEQQVANFITPELVNNPYLLGYMSDNELGFYHAKLQNYLTLDADNPNYQGAWNWLRARKGKDVALSDITAQDEKLFMGYLAGLYYQMTVEIIKKHDPNHLIMGSRIHGAGKRNEYIIRAAGQHLDVVTINYYNNWGPVLAKDWAGWMDRPFIITEWYVKGEDKTETNPAYSNQAGAGWSVPTQKDRGHFYEHFTLKLLETPQSVGWHWYRYIDHQGSNKGMLTEEYENYQVLMDAMKRINTRAYDLIEFFDGNDLTSQD